MRLWIVLILFSLLCCSCSGWKAIDSTQAESENNGASFANGTQDEKNLGPEIEIAGFYMSSFEYGGFTPCGSKEVYWTEGTEIHNAFSSLHLSRGEHAYARLRGRVIGPGSYGHMSAYRWGFSVVKVIEMRPKRHGDCE